MRGEAAAAGRHDLIVVNTCAVTSEAVRQARQTIRRLHRDHPGRPIVVTGCAAQLEPERFAAMPEVNRVLGNSEKLSRHHLAADGATAGPVAVADIMTVPEAAPHLVNGFDGRARAFLQIQQGCDHRCTFCIIPFARGPHRSLPAERIISEARRLSRAGFGELVLTGVDICSWGRDIGGRPALGELVCQLLDEVPELPRLRLSTLDPAAVDAALLTALAADPRLMPHWHLSVQALHDMVLKRMRRRHDRAAVFALVEQARRARPDIVFGADLIAGFPTESEAMFAATCDAVVELGLVWLHVFPFSPRPGTPAARMPQVAPDIRRERAARLRALGEQARVRHLATQVGRCVDVLVEQADLGRAPDYAPVRLSTPSTPGTIVGVRITGCAGDQLFGEPMGQPG
jgi:threonylcarbamoyladenosine tRNA methylthiotransferase MtaB